MGVVIGFASERAVANKAYLVLASLSSADSPNRTILTRTVRTALPPSYRNTIDTYLTRMNLIQVRWMIELSFTTPLAFMSIDSRVCLAK